MRRMVSLASEPEFVKNTRLNCARRQLGEQARELDRGRVRALEEAVVVRQLAHLARRDVRELVAAVADVDAPEPGHRVEDLLAVGVVEVDALGARDDARALGGERAEIGERVEIMPGVQLLPFPGCSLGDAGLGAHGVLAGQTFNSRCSRSHELITREKVSASFSLTAQYAATKRSPKISTSGLLPRSSASASASVIGSANGRS